MVVMSAHYSRYKNHVNYFSSPCSNRVVNAEEPLAEKLQQYLRSRGVQGCKSIYVSCSVIIS